MENPYTTNMRRKLGQPSIYLLSVVESTNPQTLLICCVRLLRLCPTEIIDYFLFRVQIFQVQIVPDAGEEFI